MRAFLFLAAVVTLAFQAAALPAQETAPELPPAQMYDLSGQSFQLKDVLGAVTVLNFWATWCGPCRLELPELQQLAKEFGGKGVSVLAINVDMPAAPEEATVRMLEVLKPRVEAFVRASGVTLPVFIMDGATSGAFGIDRIPLTLLVDRNGHPLQIYSGYSPEETRDLRKRIAALVGGRPASTGK
jgi:thiol-disulfide isomerase/thioredoxin